MRCVVEPVKRGDDTRVQLGNGLSPHLEACPTSASKARASASLARLSACPTRSRIWASSLFKRSIAKGTADLEGSGTGQFRTHGTEYSHCHLTGVHALQRMLLQLFRLCSTGARAPITYVKRARVKPFPCLESMQLCTQAVR